MDGYIIWDVLCDRAEPSFRKSDLMHYQFLVTRSEAEQTAAEKNKATKEDNRYVVRHAVLVIGSN